MTVTASGRPNRFGEHQPLRVLRGRHLVAAGGEQQVADAQARPAGRAPGHQPARRRRTTPGRCVFTKFFGRKV
jgi:hypothetical protein